MTSPALVGFASELRGNESYLLDASPVFRKYGTAFIAEGGGRPRSIQEYEVSDYTYPLPPEPYCEGEVVWLAGPGCVASLTRVLSLTGPRTRELHDILASWPGTHLDFRWTQASADHLDTAVRQAVLELHVAADEELPAGRLETTRLLIDALSSIERRDSRTSLLLAAAHYQAVGDTLRASMLARQAVRNRQATTVNAFLRRARRRYALIP